MTPTPDIPLDAQAIVVLQDAMTAEWHRPPAPDAGSETPAADFITAVRLQHQTNFEIWHLEDEARAPNAADREITEVKRGIDRANQRRNDLMERCDTLLLEALVPRGLPAVEAPLHSETPGMILDRLSILALKIFHTREETLRGDADESHIRRNIERLRLLEGQRSDLAGCLDQLWAQIVRGERRFKLYRQLKMYNDPSLNPAVYRKSRG
jgi:hypothetical protein